MVAATNTTRVVLVGFENQENLGLRYLSSCLKQAGHQTHLVNITNGPEDVLKAIQTFQPHVVGFSLIFQYFVPHFATLLAYLRSKGITTHFTMGGHYASFEPQVVLEKIPELDSVVRFEGEDALLELTERVAAGLPWNCLPGIAFRGSEGIVISTTRPGRENLDSLPWPDRDDIHYEAQKLPTASMLGSRGCPWHCSFCSIITFYEGNGTKGRRCRDPIKVVDELEYLHQKRGVRIILWQDDDFLSGGKVGITWAHTIANECIKRGLHKGLRWKISCRSDEVSKEALEPLVAAGLTHVYMGIESGDPDNLKNLNKHLKPEAHIQAGKVLRQLGLSFDFGFMLLEPWSTFATVRNNIAFLREFAGDGAAAVSFCRTLPYTGTPLTARLKAEGRLLEKDFNVDYYFLDPQLNIFYNWLLNTLSDRNFSASGTANQLRLLLFEAHINMPDRPVDPEFQQWVWSLTSLANRILLDTIETALDHIEFQNPTITDDSTLETLKMYYAAEDDRLRQDLNILVQRCPDIQERLHLIYS